MVEAGVEGPAAGHGAVKTNPDRVTRDMYLFEVKGPAESHHPGDYLKLLQTIPAGEAFRALNAGGCPLVPKG